MLYRPTLVLQRVGAVLQGVGVVADLDNAIAEGADINELLDSHTPQQSMGYSYTRVSITSRPDGVFLLYIHV